MKLASYYKADYSGGLNSTASLREIAPNEATALQNFDITYQGQLRQRNGLTLMGNVPNAPCTGLAAFIRDTGLDMLRTHGGTLEYLAGTMWQPLANTLVVGNPFWMENVQIKGKLYLCNTDNVLQFWDRSSTTLNSALGTPTNSGNPVPHGNVMRWFNNFMFMLNKVKVGSTLYTEDIFWSALGNPDVWNTTTDHTTVPGDGQLITAVPLGDNLVLFKERSIQYLTGFSDNSFAIVSNASSYASAAEEVGCVAPRGACQVGNEVWFIDNEANIRRITRTDFDAFRHEIVSTKIRASLDKINKGQIQQALMWVWDNKVYCAVPNGTDLVSSIVFVFDLIASRRGMQSPYSFPPEAWTTYTGWNPSMAMAYPTNVTMDLYLGDAITGAVYKHAGVDDNGVAVNAVYEDANTDYQLPFIFKNYVLGYLSADSQTGDTSINMDTSIDGSPYVNQGVLTISATGTRCGPTGSARCGPTGNARCGGSAQGLLRFFYNNSGQLPLGRLIRHRITHNKLGQQPAINAYSSQYRPRAMR